MTRRNQHSIRIRLRPIALIAITAAGLNAPATADGVALAPGESPGAAPHAVIVSPAVLDLGNIEAGQHGEGHFWIINNTDHAVELTAAKGSCGCITFRNLEPGTLQPGQAMPIELTMEASTKRIDATATKTVSLAFDNHEPIEASVRITSIDPLVAKVYSYIDARKRADSAAVQSILSTDSRVWFETKEGPGRKREANGDGPWAGWDREMHATGKKSDFRRHENTVTGIIWETNDYFRLLERTPGRIRITYYFDADERIEGSLVQGIDDAGKPQTSRFDEFYQWAKENHPDEIQYLYPDEKIVPSAERAQRWRTLLIKWREVAGLERISIGS